MQANSVFSRETLAALGLKPDAVVHPAADAEKLGIDLNGAEHDAVDESDFVVKESQK